MTLDDKHAAPPFPLPDLHWPLLQPYWQAAARGVLSLPRCDACAAFNWYPADACRACACAAFTWQPVSGRARLYAWAEVSRALDPRLAPLAPYVSAIVTLEEDSNVRLVTRIVDTSAPLRIDLPLQACFVDLGHPALVTGVKAPLFRAVT